MGRAKKDFKPLNIRLDSKVHDQLELYCSMSGQSKTVATERALATYIQAYFKLQENNNTADEVEQNG